MRPSTDRTQGGDAPAFLTKGVLLRFEEGLRAQREQRARSTDQAAHQCRREPVPGPLRQGRPPPKDQSTLVQLLSMLGSGAVTFLLGIVILAYWPVSSIYVLGLLLGIDLVFAGAAWIATAYGPRSVLKIGQVFGMNLRLFLWIAALFTESAAIYCLALLAYLHHRV